MTEAEIDAELADMDLEAELDAAPMSTSSVSSSSMTEAEIDAELADLEAELDNEEAGLDNDPDISAELAQLDAEVDQMRNHSHDKMDKALNKLSDKLGAVEDHTDLMAEQIEEKLDQQMDLADLELEQSYDNHAVIGSAMDEALGLNNLDHDPEVNDILRELGVKTGPKTQADRNFDDMMSRLEVR